MYLLYRHYKKKRQAKAELRTPQTPQAVPSVAVLNNGPESTGTGTTTEAAAGKTGSSKTSVRWRIILLFALAIPVFLETLDYTVVATAQPHIASVFNALNLQSYIGTIYLLTSTVFLPFFASLADIYGRYTALQLSLLFFIVGSAISTGAQNMATVLAGRGIAGIGAAGLLIVVRVIMADSSSLDENNWQVSLLFLLYAIGYSVGPVIGGALTSTNWRWVFAINLPCCAVAILTSALLLRKKLKPGQPTRWQPNSERETQFQKLFRVDWIGTVLFVGAGIPFLLALNWGSTETWNEAKVIACFVVGGVLFIACLLWEYLLERQQLSPTPTSVRLLRVDPMIPLVVFRNFDVCVVQYASFVSGMVMLVMFYFVAIFMTIVTGFSPTKAGVQLIYFAPGMGAGTYISIILIKTTRQPRYPIILGGAIVTVALGLISMAMDKNKQGMVNGFMVMAGAGVGLSLSSAALQARFSQPGERVAVVSGLLLFFRSLGGTVGLAQSAAVLNGKVNSFLSDLVKSGQLDPLEVSALINASHGGLGSLQSLDSLPANVQQLVRDAFRNGTRWSFISLIPWCGVAFILTLFLSKIKDSDRKNSTSPPEGLLEVDETKDTEHAEKSSHEINEDNRV